MTTSENYFLLFSVLLEQVLVAEAYLEPSRTSMMERYCGNSLRLKP